MTNRHPSVEEKMVWLTPNENLPSEAYEIAYKCKTLADQILANVEDHPQLALGLQHLIDAKDCFVRARLVVNMSAPTNEAP